MKRLIVMALLAASAAFPADKGGWIPLFNGKNLDGWRVEGQARWTAEGGALVGRQGPAGEPGDLYTEKEWADFEFECEYMVKYPANTGIWFRRNASQPGYQADILDEPQHPEAKSGSLYAMGKGFIATHADGNLEKKNAWNRMTIRAAGEEIVIGLNGKTVVTTRDSRFLKPGSIGVQVHRGDAFKGMEIRLRQMRVRPVAK